MLSPYILKNATTHAKAECITYFLRDCFEVCARQMSPSEKCALADCDLFWDFDNNTCLPVFLRKKDNLYDLATDPTAPFGKAGMYTSAAFFHAVDKEHQRLTRLEHFLRPRFFAEGDCLAKQATHSLQGWYQLTNLIEDNTCAAIVVERNGKQGLIDPRGKTIVPTLYNSIVPFSLEMRHVDLFVCRRGEKYTNTVDVYDINGNKIYGDIGGLYLQAETVRYSFCPQEGNRPTARFAEKLQVIQYVGIPVGDDPPRYKVYERNVQNLRLLPVADKDDGPKRIQRFCGDDCFGRNRETVDLRDVYGVFFSLAQKVADFYGNTPEEIMLSIPHWFFFRVGHKSLEWALPDLPLHLMLDVPAETKETLETLGMRTASDIANADFSDLSLGDRSLEIDIYCLQLQLQYTFAHPPKPTDEE